MAKSSNSIAENPHFSLKSTAKLNIDVTSLTFDEKYLYVGCQDNQVRVWTKDAKQQVAALDEPVSLPLAIHVDADQIYATCEKRVYVWRKQDFGIIGWFDLTYPAITSTLQGDNFYVGAEDGRLVSIKKDTHETFSWQLHKADIVSLWADSSIICTITKKEPIKIWEYQGSGTPTEVFQISKVKDAVLTGNATHIFIGTNNGEVRVLNRDSWIEESTLTISKLTAPITSIWCNSMYLVALFGDSHLVLWTLKNPQVYNVAKIDGEKFRTVLVDRNRLYLAGPSGIMVAKFLYDEKAINLYSDDFALLTGAPLRSSPYDVLEDVLARKTRGDTFYQENQFPQAVAEYEKALQLLIDNTRTLNDVPQERDKLMDELNSCLGMALLKTKIEEIAETTRRLKELLQELDEKGLVSLNHKEIEQLISRIARSIKEGKVLADAQSENILSYQLATSIDELDALLKVYKEKLSKYQAQVDEAHDLVESIDSEWRRLERSKSTLQARLEFLEKTMAILKDHLDKQGILTEVRSLLEESYGKYNHLLNQIVRIVRASESTYEGSLSKDETVAAIKSLLKVFPQKLKQIESIEAEDERAREIERLETVLNQALESARKFKLKGLITKINGALSELRGDERPEPEESPPAPKKKKKRKKTTTAD